jgi:hypothetical protein
MPPEAAIFVTAVLFAFAVFAVTLAWGLKRAGSPAGK